jgi:hypothetical protein
MDIYWAPGHALAMTDILSVEIPISAGTPTASMLSGLSAAPVAMQSLSCYLLPGREQVRKDQSGYLSLPVGFCVYDPDGLCVAERIIHYQNSRYRITTLTKNTNHEYVTIRLEQVG